MISADPRIKSVQQGSRKIKKNEELTYDYGFSFDCNYKDHICKCGSKNCVGFIVREGSRWRLKKQTNI